MDVPENVETGYRAGEQSEWCARWAGSPTTLCGLKVDQRGRKGWFAAPPLGPSDPATGHPECVRLLEEMTVEPVPPPDLSPPPSGLCPLCLTRVQLEDGKVTAHGACPGVNLPPKGAL